MMNLLFEILNFEFRFLNCGTQPTLAFLKRKQSQTKKTAIKNRKSKMLPLPGGVA
jgi:hypothetical protein